LAGEYYPGWFDHWGEPHHEVPVSGPATDIAWLLDNGYSFNLYVFHGGTNFGFMNGANYSTAVPYQPTTTSYDYDAPLAEGGYPTQKYDLLRSTIVAHAGIAPPPVPAPPARIVIPEFSFAECAPLADLYGGPIASQRPRHLEAFDQAYGYIVYRTQITGPERVPCTCVRCAITQSSSSPGGVSAISIGVWVNIRSTSRYRRAHIRSTFWWRTVGASITGISSSTNAPASRSR
jgi:hypothetical protein